MDAAVDGNRFGVRAYLGRYCDNDPKAVSKAAMQIRRMAEPRGGRP
jgi:hypothetical protein